MAVMGALTGPHLIALDGGNSKTDVLLVTHDGTVVARTRSGPFAPHIVGAEAAVARLAPAVRGALASAGLDRVEMIAGYLANADLPEEEQAIGAAIRAYDWADRVVIENDTLAMLRTGTDAVPSVAVVCGGGINCVGVAGDGRHVRYPAIGRASGDWGGGFSLGKEALWHTSRHEDGRGPATLLSELVAQRFGTADAVSVATGMHLGVIDRDRMHEIVPLIFTAADRGDGIAAELIRRQADEVALLATTTIRRIDALAVPVEVVLGGGILTTRHPLLLDPVLAGIAEAAPFARVSILDDAPIVGSALLGLDRLDESTGTAGDSSARRDRLRATLGSAKTEGAAPHGSEVRI